MALTLSNKEQGVCNTAKIINRSFWNIISQKPLTALGNLIGVISIVAGTWFLVINIFNALFFVQS